VGVFGGGPPEGAGPPRRGWSPQDGEQAGGGGGPPPRAYPSDCNGLPIPPARGGGPPSGQGTEKKREKKFFGFSHGGVGPFREGGTGGAKIKRGGAFIF